MASKQIAIRATPTPIVELINREFYQRLQEANNPVVEVLINHPECFTATGRLNKSAVARVLGCKTNGVEELLLRLRQHMREYGDD